MVVISLRHPHVKLRYSNYNRILFDHIKAVDCGEKFTLKMAFVGVRSTSFVNAVMVLVICQGCCTFYAKENRVISGPLTSLFFCIVIFCTARRL